MPTNVTATALSPDPQAILTEVFGYERFRGHQ